MRQWRRGEHQLCLDIYELYQESSMKADGDRYLEAAVKIEPKNDRGLL